MKRVHAEHASPAKNWTPSTAPAQQHRRHRAVSLHVPIASQAESYALGCPKCACPVPDVGLGVPESAQRDTESRPEPVRMLKQEHRLAALLQDYLMKSPEALVFLDRNGAVLYMNTQGEAQFSRWNRALRHDRESASLPAVLRPDSAQGGRTTQHHPELPGFSATLESVPDGFVLRLDDTHQGSSGTLSAQALSVLQKLSLSEQRVARLAVEGLRNAQIAQRLNRSRRTVEFQLRRTFQKLDISNRVQLSRLLR